MVMVCIYDVAFTRNPIMTWSECVCVCVFPFLLPGLISFWFYSATETLRTAHWRFRMRDHLPNICWYFERTTYWLGLCFFWIFYNFDSLSNRLAGGFVAVAQIWRVNLWLNVCCRWKLDEFWNSDLIWCDVQYLWQKFSWIFIYSIFGWIGFWLRWLFCTAWYEDDRWLIKRSRKFLLFMIHFINLIIYWSFYILKYLFIFC